MTTRPRTPSANTALAKNIHRLLDAFGWTQREMSRECGLSEKAIEKILASGKCGSDTLQKIRGRTGASLNWLVCNEGEAGITLTAQGHTVAIIKRMTRRPPAPRK